MKRLIWLSICLFLMVSCNEEADDIFGRYTGTQRFGLGQTESSLILEFNFQGVSYTGAITPPGSSTLVPIEVVEFLGNSTRFTRRDQSITYIYSVSFQNDQAQGTFEPLGCDTPSSGEECPTDSDGSFTATK